MQTTRLPLAFTLALGLQLCSAQTNPPTTDFQGFHPGDLVKVQCQRPLIVLGQALFQSQTASNIVFLSKGERFVLSKTNVVLDIPSMPRGTSTGTVLTIQETMGTAPDTQLLLLGVQQKILGAHENEKGYAKASNYYQDTMSKYLKGDLTLEQIVEDATRTLKQADQFMPERANDPQYESQIKFLKDFVQRAQNGEKVGASNRPD
jgi:hypothetical protein